MSATAIAAIVSRVGEKALIPFPVTPHMLRHSLATHLSANGVQICDIQALLGHADINTTTIYTQVDNRQLENAYYSTHPRANSKNVG